MVDPARAFLMSSLAQPMIAPNSSVTAPTTVIASRAVGDRARIGLDRTSRYTPAVTMVAEHPYCDPPSPLRRGRGGRADRPGGGWARGLFAAALAFPDHDRDGEPVWAGDAVGWAVRSSRGSGRAGPLRGGWRRRAWRLRRRGSCGLCRGSGPRVSRFHRRGRRLPRVPGRRLRGG